jgi:hypothetical protein
MRSPAEIAFRVKQEAANLTLFLNPPDVDVDQPAPFPGLPDPATVVERLKGSPFEADVVQIADSVLDNRIPLLGLGEYPLGTQIQWRRDYVNEKQSDPVYFRRVRYLDFALTGDHKFIWELNRHQFLVVLAQAWRFTGKHEYLHRIPSLIESWDSQNPYMRGINWTSALEVAFRVWAWAWTYHLCASALDPAFRKRWLTVIYRHGLYLEYNLSVYFSPNTHLLGEAVVLDALGRWFPSFPHARQWRQTASALTISAMRSQVREDGGHFEQSTYYHVYALDFFLIHAIVNRDIPEWFRERLSRMASFLHAIVAPSGKMPFFGDDDGGRLFHPYGDRRCFALATLASCSVFFQKSEWMRSVDALAEQAEWWMDAQAPVPQREVRRSCRFGDSGMFVLASGDLQVVVDAGPFGSGSAGHSHADTLSLIVNAGGEEILIDPGTYTYVSDPVWRNRFRGTAFHNTIQVDGMDQAVPVNPFRWSAAPDVEVLRWDGRTIDACCRYRGVIHRRSVTLDDRGILLILDQVQGPDGEHDVRQFWHAGAAVTAISANRFAIGANTQLILTESAAVEDSWRSCSFASKQPAPVIVVRRRASFPLMFGAVLSFGAEVRSVQVEDGSLVIDGARFTPDSVR